MVTLHFRGVAMDRAALIDELKILRDYVGRNHTSLAETEMVLDTTVFTDPERHRAETERLYRNYPICVGPSCLLPAPGDYFTFSDTGVPLLLVRGTDGVVRGFLNMCSHRNAPVATGQGRAKLFTCPFHAWTYDLEGKLRGIAYQKDGFPNCADKSAMGLQPVQVAEKNGLIFVLPNPVGSFDVNEVEGGIGADLMAFGLKTNFLYDTARMVVKQNYKSLLEGYHDFYHFAALHPNTIAKLTYSNIGNYKQFGRGHRFSSPSLTIGQLDDMPESEWPLRQNITVIYYCFPATVFFVVSNHFQVWRVYPIDQQTSVVYQSMYLDQKPRTPEEEAAVRRFFDMINQVVLEEDYWLGELIQRGLNSGIRRPFILGRNEIAVQNMHRQIDDVMHRGGQDIGLRAVG